MLMKIKISGILSNDDGDVNDNRDFKIRDATAVRRDRK